MCRTMRCLLVMSSVAAIAAVSLLFSPTRVGAAPPDVKAPGKYFGAGKCEGAACHSKKEARENPPILTEHTTWAYEDPNTGAAFDRHSVAFKRLKDKIPLTNPDGKTSTQIMEALNKIEGTKDTAEKSERCLTCHGVAVHDYGDATGGVAVGLHKELQGGGFKPDDGVSCDGCHGPAEKWLKPHDKNEWAMKKWAELGGAKDGGSLKLYNQFGIYYSKDLELWANQCVRCHLKIDTNMIDAGHPDLVPFELFGHNQVSYHWRDYSSAKEGEADLPAPGPFHAAAVWQTGQAAAFHSAASQIEQRAKGEKFNKGTPEHMKVAYDRAYGHYVMFRHAVRKIAPDVAKAIDGHMEEIKKAMGDKPDNAALGVAGAKLTAAVKPLIEKMAHHPVKLDYLKGVMSDMVNDPAAVENKRTAEQLSKSLYALQYAHLYATNAQGKLTDGKDGAPSDPVILAVYKMYETFDPSNAEFKAAVATVSGALKK